jgi:hypothetical protein
MIECFLSTENHVMEKYIGRSGLRGDLASCLTDGCAKNLKPWQVVM